MTGFTSIGVVLAAGKGTRMKSDKPKVLHEIAGLPMLGHVLTALRAAQTSGAVVVVSPDGEQVRAFAERFEPRAEVAVQEQALGTGDAVRAGLPHIGSTDAVIVVFGDTPLIRAETISKMAGEIEAGRDIVVLGFQSADPTGYGRLILGPDGALERIVEEKDATAVERAVTLCNGGGIAVRSAHLPTLSQTA